MLSDEEKQAIKVLNHFNPVDCGREDTQAIETILNLIEKQSKEIVELKDTKKELTERVLKLESDKFWDNVVSKSKIKQIIYPTPENEIPIEVQQSEMYKKLLKEMEE